MAGGQSKNDQKVFESATAIGLGTYSVLLYMCCSSPHVVTKSKSSNRENKVDYS